MGFKYQFLKSKTSAVSLLACKSASSGASVAHRSPKGSLLWFLQALVCFIGQHKNDLECRKDLCPHVSPCVLWVATITPPCSGATQWRGAGFIPSLPKGTEQHFAKKGEISQPNSTGAALNSNMSEIKHRI